MVRNDGIIPSEARLFRRIHKKDYWNLIRAASKVPPDYVPPKLFRPNVQGELSVDWDKFNTPEQTRSHTGHPEDFGVMQLITRDVRSIPLRVLWTPEPNN